jgi:phenylacetate-CoA ligase
VAARSQYVVWGLPSYIARVGVELLEHGIELPRSPVAVIASGETLTTTDTAVIERAFRCRVLNHYSSFEALHLAQTCPDVPELLHVNSEHALLRIVREDGTDAPPGESGRVVITDLANWVMPLINYDIGDRAVAGGPCPCGRGFPTLMSLEGRAGERIKTPSGKMITPTALGWLITTVFRMLPYVWEYQAIQTAADAVILRIVPTADFTEELATKLARAAETFLGPGMRVRVETVERIAVEASGKRLVIKSELPS